MTDTITAAEYAASIHRQKQWPQEKQELYAWLADFAKREFLSAVTEHRFHPKRRWRFDWAFLDPIKVAVEFNGLFGGMAHRSVNEAVKDAEKLNAAQTLGWIVVQVNTVSLRDGSGYTAITEAVQQRQDVK